MSKMKIIDTFFKKTSQKSENVSNVVTSTPTSSILEASNMNTLAPQQDSSKSKRPRLNPEQMEVCHLIRDPGIRPMIWKFLGLNYILHGSNAFIENGFRNWKKVNSGKDCPLLNHIGKGPNSFYHRATKSCDDLMKQSQHVDTLMKRKTSEKIENHRRRLGVSIDCIRWLTFQGCAYRGHDESLSSDNRGKFIELLKFLGSYNSSVQKLVLENAPRFAKYTSSDVQKEILYVLTTMVRNSIRKDIRDAKFCIIIDEVRDEFKKEQMAIVLRFVDVDGFVRERFFDLVHGYDGASNMRGEWNGLQALFLNDCRQAYYVHCFAHRLQLALVAASREVLQIHEFFTQLIAIVNIVSASCKRHNQLQEDQEIENAKLIANDELKTGQGVNQMGTLQRAGDTRWSSHFHSVCSLIRMFAATQTVLNNIIDDGTTSAQRGEAYGVNKVLSSFEFIFSLHLMKKIMGITNILCQALQQKSQDILNAMHVVSTTSSKIEG
ncbi:Zinc finger MYM-type protein [Arachis hypogaea]|nr:Zinc finger MYM-type protein [Arachis hypogaea]